MFVSVVCFGEFVFELWLLVFDVVEVVGMVCFDLFLVLGLILCNVGDGECVFVVVNVVLVEVDL